jgi:peptide/nickel transport system permease protein
MIGAYEMGLKPGLNLAFIGSVIKHGTLPALSIILVSFGYWTLGMRGMMITVEGEDYMQLARAKGLRPLYVLYRYMVRNAILPQVTAFAITLGTLVSGQILVEYIFSYQGMGTVIFNAITTQDFPVIQGTSFVLIVMTATAVFIIDLLYPLIDPRISYERN